MQLQVLLYSNHGSVYNLWNDNAPITVFSLLLFPDFNLFLFIYNKSWIYGIIKFILQFTDFYKNHYERRVNKNH